MIFTMLWFPRQIEQCSRAKITRLRKFGGLGIPDIKSRCDALLVSRMTKIVNADLTDITETWHHDALEQIGTRITRITPSLYSNLRRNADVPDPQYQRVLKIYDLVQNASFEWKKAKIKHIYYELNNTLQTNIPWAEVLLQDDTICHFFVNAEREIAWRTVNDAYKWRKFRNRHDSLYSYIPGYNVIASQQCIICNRGEDTIQHLLTQCQVVKQIWIKANKIINKLITHRIILDDDIITRNITPSGDARATWLVPLKMVNIIKSNLISCHENFSTAKSTLGVLDAFINKIVSEAEEDLHTFIAKVFASRGQIALEKYHIKARRVSVLSQA